MLITQKILLLKNTLFPNDITGVHHFEALPWIDVIYIYMNKYNIFSVPCSAEEIMILKVICFLCFQNFPMSILYILYMWGGGGGRGVSLSCLGSQSKALQHLIYLFMKSSVCSIRLHVKNKLESNFVYLRHQFMSLSSCRCYQKDWFVCQREIFWIK